MTGPMVIPGLKIPVAGSLCTLTAYLGPERAAPALLVGRVLWVGPFVWRSIRVVDAWGEDVTDLLDADGEDAIAAATKVAG